MLNVYEGLSTARYSASNVLAHFPTRPSASPQEYRPARGAVAPGADRRPQQPQPLGSLLGTGPESDIGRLDTYQRHNWVKRLTGQENPESTGTRPASSSLHRTHR